MSHLGISHVAPLEMLEIRFVFFFVSIHNLLIIFSNDLQTFVRSNERFLCEKSTVTLTFINFYTFLSNRF